MKSISDIAAIVMGIAVVVMAVIGVFDYVAETTATDWNDFFSMIGIATVLVVIFAAVWRAFGLPWK